MGECIQNRKCLFQTNCPENENQYMTGAVKRITIITINIYDNNVYYKYILVLIY